MISSEAQQDQLERFVATKLVMTGTKHTGGTAARTTTFASGGDSLAWPDMDARPR
jgi:hypothetical protein